MKRANKTGTIYKLSGKRRNPWIARLCLGYDEEANRIWRTIGYYRTKAEATTALELARIKPLPERPNITLSEIFNEWRAGAEKNVSDSTKQVHDFAFSHIASLGGYKFADLRQGHFQQIINGLDLSYSSLHKIKVLVGQLYEYAMLNDICLKNYAKGIVLPKKTQKPKETFTDAEIKMLFDHDDLPWVDAVLCLIYTGFRIQELLNITKFDVDFNRGIIRGGLKTEAGKNRIVPIHPKILKYIQQRYMSCEQYLFETSPGANDAHNFRNRQYKKALQAVGISYKSPHCCRHTCATILSREGVDTIAIKQILGHTSYAFTADVYTHEDIDFLKKEMLKMT